MSSRFILSFCALLLLYQSLFAQTCTSLGTGNWQTNSTWSCSPFPQGDNNGNWSGTHIVIDSDVTLANSNPKTIDLSGINGVEKITIKANRKLIFENNTKLLLPASAVIELEEGAQIVGPSNNSNTLIQVGDNGVWGKCDGCSRSTLTGPGTVNYGGVTLPIELLYFKGKASEDGVELEWATASEKNFDFFSIERSSDARSFNSITEIKGQGESVIPVHYGYTDKHVISGLMYYRLKAVDFDGYTEYFNVIAVYVPPVKNMVQIYPNPVQGKEFTIEINMESRELTEMLLQDLSGKTVFQQKLTHRLNKVTLKPRLNSGVYTLIVRGGQMSHSQLLMLE